MLGAGKWALKRCCRTCWHSKVPFERSFWPLALLVLKSAARALLLCLLVLKSAAHALLLGRVALENYARKGWSRMLRSVMLNSVPLYSALLYSVHGYARVSH